MKNPPQWNVPGWDWDEGDYSWLSSQSGIYKDGVSIFFIHGGRIRHQAHIPYGSYTVDEFCKMLRDRAAGLDDVRVEWMADTGGGDLGLWVNGTRPPNEDDLARLQAARDRQAYEDRSSVHGLRQRHPEWFSDKAPSWDAGAHKWVNDPCSPDSRTSQSSRDAE